MSREIFLSLFFFSLSLKGKKETLTVLHDIADNAKVIKVAATALGAKRLLEGDLDIVNVFAVPGLAEEDVCETKSHQILDHLLAKIVIDAIDLIAFISLPSLLFHLYELPLLP